MSDRKINKKYICGDSFKITTDDIDHPEQYIALSHDTDNAQIEVGAGSKMIKHVDSMVLNDDEYFDLPAYSSGHGFFLVGDGEEYAEITWMYTLARGENTDIVLVNNSTNVDDADTDTDFCIFDNTTTARVKNRLGSAKRITFEYEYTTRIYAPTFKIFGEKSGVDQLDPNLTINGTTVTPKFRYKLGDADATDLAPWGYGETLTRVSVATPPTYNDGSPGLGANDDSCKFNASDYYKKTTATASQFTTGDIVAEVVFKFVDEVKYYLSTLGTNGVVILGNSNKIGLYINDAGGVATAYSDTSLVEGQWYHFIAFINRDEASTNGSQCHINGVSSGLGVDCSAISGTLTSSDLAIGASVTGSVPTEATIAYLAAWELADWMQAAERGPQEWADIARERFLKFSGIYPQVYNSSATLIADGDMEAVGTASWTAADATLSKDTTAPLYEGTQHLRITATLPTFYAGQSILAVGFPYRVTGACRSVSGSAVTRISDGVGVGIWYGTSSTDWQEFDFTFINAGNTYIYFGSASASGVVDFDDIVVTRLGNIPMTAERDYPAYLDKVEGDYRKLYYVGNQWMRMCHRQDVNDENVYGYLPEPEGENLVANSEVFTSYWGKIDAGDVPLDDQIACPDGRVVGGSIAADSTPGPHGLQKALTVTAAVYTYSWFAKPGNKNWVHLVNSTVANCDCYFDVANGTVGTAGAGATGYIEGPYTGGWYRICIVFTGTAASHTFQLRVADADLDDTISDGDGSTVNLYLWGAQVELSDYMTSPVICSGSALTRLKDELQFVAEENIGFDDAGQGTIACDILYSNYDKTVTSQLYAISDSADAINNRVLGYVYTTDDFRVTTRASGGNDGDANTSGTDCVDGEKHAVRQTWQTDNLIPYVDGVAGTADTSCAMPNDLDELVIGANRSQALQANGLIQNLRLYYQLLTED